MALISVRHLLIIPCLLATLTISYVPGIVHAENKATSAAAGVVEIIQRAAQAEQLNCSLHLGRRQCRSADRCHQTLTYLQAASSGNHNRILELEKYRSDRIAQDRCVRSLIGNTYPSLLEHLQVHTREMTRLNQRRANN